MILFEDSCRNSHKDPFCHVIFSGFSSLKILFGTIFRGSSLFLPTDYKRIDGILTRHGLGDALDAVRCVLILLSLIRLQLVGHRLELGNQDDLGLRNGDHQLPVLLLESVEFHFVGLVLSFLLETARPGGQFILLLPGFGSDGHGQFADGRHVVDEPVELVQFPADAVQLPGVRRQVVAVAASRLATAIASRTTFNNCQHSILDPFISTKSTVALATAAAAAILLLFK